jgi:protein-S-isoprenylcysteine O-methyltransferase Ste14
MSRNDADRLGYYLFYFRGLYIYLTIAVATAIAFITRDPGPFADAAADRAWIGAAIGVAAAGALIRIITSGFAALGTSGRVKSAPEAAELNTTGPYSLVRNPLYVGRIVNYTGLAMLSGNWLFSIAVFVLSVLIYVRISRYEAAFLKSKFGEQFDKWAASTPLLLPRLTGWVKPKYAFWWKRMIWREQHKLFQMAAGIFLAWFARRGFEMSAIAPSEMIWVYAFGAVIALRLLIAGLSMAGYFKDMR